VGPPQLHDAPAVAVDPAHLPDGGVEPSDRVDLRRDVRLARDDPREVRRELRGMERAGDGAERAPGDVRELHLDAELAIDERIHGRGDAVHAYRDGAVTRSDRRDDARRPGIGEIPGNLGRDVSRRRRRPNLDDIARGRLVADGHPEDAGREVLAAHAGLERGRLDREVGPQEVDEDVGRGQGHARPASEASHASRSSGLGRERARRGGLSPIGW